MKHNESDLLHAARSLNTEALGAIFDEYSTAIYNYTLRLCQDTVEADNITGDVFSQLLEQFARGKGPETNLRSYLYQTAYRLIVDHARERKRLGAEDLLDLAASQDLPVALQAERDAELDAIGKAMRNLLTADQQHVLMLRFVEGFDVEETAHILGKTIANVKVIQSRGVEKLRQALGKEYQ